jgi:hypothetical protein
MSASRIPTLTTRSTAARRGDATVVWLSDDQAEAARYAVADLVARRRLAGRPVPAAVVALHRTLVAASGDGTEIGCRGEESGDDLIDAAAAAELLGCSSRWVRRIRADLGGRKVAGRWVFDRHTVVEYARARAD